MHLRRGAGVGGFASCCRGEIFFLSLLFEQIFKTLATESCSIKICYCILIENVNLRHIALHAGAAPPFWDECPLLLIWLEKATY